MKVLIADDSGEVRERIKMLLSDMEMIEMIVEAGNVQQAIEQIGPERALCNLTSGATYTSNPCRSLSDG